MDDEYGSSYITLEDDDGNEIELEHLDTIEFENQEYMVFLPADMDEDNPDFGLIILKTVEENGEEILADVEDPKELNRVYEYYMENIFDNGEEIPEE
jgi:uncharacterized protein YrzB (UPF0473 family)